jgi:hypothetical protein
MPIAGKTHFRKHHQFNASFRSLSGEAANGGEVGGFVSGRMLKLHGGNARVSHGWMVRKGSNNVEVEKLLAITPINIIWQERCCVMA